MKKILAFFIISVMSVTQVFAIPSKVIPIGRTAGIAVMYDGVLVASISNVDTEHGFISPAENAGISQGDIIKEIDGQKVLSNENIVEIVTKSNGKQLEVVFERNSQILTTTITPLKDKIDNLYKIGIWVRDSMAGIGTITYIDPETNIYGGLGHSISETSKGKATEISKGTLISSSVSDVIKGEVGKAGELNATYNASTNLGSIEINSHQGIFGVTTKENYFINSQAVDVAQFFDVTTGTAQVLTNVSGENVCAYEIEITAICDNQNDDINFTVKIIDQELLEITGGIVQGMSGSPIMQNGKIVGALTHVLVNDPTVGYAIYIGNMLKTAENLAS